MKAPALAVLALAALALPARAQQKPESTAVAAHAPLAPFAGRKLVVLPAGYLLAGDSMGWSAQIQDPQQYLKDFDAELEFALKDRHLGKAWVMSSKLQGEYRRNEDYMADPYQLAGEFLRYPGPTKPIEFLPDPFAGQIRSILSINDKAEYVLYPIEIRFIPTPGGKGGVAALRAGVFDPRRNKTDWMGDVYSEPETTFSPALLTSLAEHLADLFATP
ncbi:MAG TPA: hypothetical protein VMT93_01205 [Gemmatimonadaceae bacterium]|nr:hypothetical protein [Gemmatimonadaceae bacterium]